MTVRLTDLLQHLPVPERRVEVHIDADGAVPRVDLSPYPNGDQRGGPYPKRPIRNVHVLLPDPDELPDVAEHDAAVRDRYLSARKRTRTDSAELKVAFCSDGEARETLDEVMIDLDLAVGVATGTGTCLLGVSDGYRGRGTGRVLTIAMPERVAARDQWLVLLAVDAAVSDAIMAEHERGGMFIAGQHELPDPPSMIDVRIDGQVHQVAVVEVVPGYWPKRPTGAPDDRYAIFERAWAEAFPGLRPPIGWLQEEMRQRDPDPRRVPDPPFHMSSNQRAAFARLWSTTWPIPAALEAFADRPGWQRALDLAETLTVATAGEWSREVELLPHGTRDRWCQNAEALIPITAAAIYAAARQADIEIDDVPVCTAGELLAGDRYRDLPDELPLDSRLAHAWRERGGADPRDLRAVRLRAQHILSCPHPGSAPRERRCVSVRERIEAGSQPGWSHLTASEIISAFEDGDRPATCEHCGASGPWLFARPAHTWWWAWALCRCGNALQIALTQDSRNSEVEWSSATHSELERIAHERGFGMLISWTDPEPPLMRDLASEIGRTLPSMAAGGDQRWREALRMAAQELAAHSDHPAVPRSSDSAIFAYGLYPAVTLAALALYALSEQPATPPRRLVLQALLAAGPDELHRQLADALHGIDRARRPMPPAWAMRVEQWPGSVWFDPEYHHIDPVPVAWATLTPSGDSASPGGRFQTGYRLLAALLAPAA